MQARIISLYGTPFSNDKNELINEIKKTIGDNYGLAGPRFIEKLMRLTKTEIEQTRNRVTDLHKKLIENSGPSSEVASRMAKHIAVVWSAAELFNKWFMHGIDLETTMLEAAKYAKIDVVNEDMADLAYQGK
jgi:hypothetical protein